MLLAGRLHTGGQLATMRVLMFGWEFPPQISGGLGTACDELTRALAHRGVRVLFVLPRADLPERRTRVRLLSAQSVEAPHGEEPSREFLSHLTVHAVDSVLRPYLTEPEYIRALEETERRIAAAAPGTPGFLRAPSPYAGNLMAEVARYSDVADVLAYRETFDVIHAHDWMTFPAAVRARKASGRPLVVHVHALESDRAGATPNPDVVRIEKMGLMEADHVIAVSHYTRGTLVEHYGVPPGKISVVHNAVSKRTAGTVYHLRQKKYGRIVLFLGRITFQKGPEYFIDAAARVLAEVPDVTFVMAGVGDMLPRMVERVGKLRIGRRFHFTGFLHGHEVERMYAMSDLYVMPSVSEPFGISPLEAMLYDVPVIVSSHAGVAEVLTHALKVDFWNVDDIANKILAVLKYPALSRELLRNGRRQLRTLRWDTAAERVLDVYNRLCR